MTSKYYALKNQKGVAMLMALVTMTVLGILAAQLVYDTEVYHRIVFNNIDKLRSRYLAKSALRLGLLQLHALNKAREKAKSIGDGNMIGEDTFDMIWQTPIILPAPVPPDSDGFEKSAIEEFNKSLGLNGRLSVTIQGESDKLNLNEMIWVDNPSAAGAQPNPQGSKTTKPSQPTQPTQALDPEQLKQKLEARRKNFIDMLKQLIDDQKTADEKFERKYSSISAETLIKNIAAWIDQDLQEDGDNRPKEDYYRTLPTPYGLKNAPLFSLSEIHMIKGFDDTLSKIIFDNFAASVTDGLHINTASRSLLKALIPTLEDRDLDAIIARREGTDESAAGPFKDAEDFWKFLNTLGDYNNAKKELTEKGIKLTTKETAYRVMVDASSGNATRSWQAYIGALPPDVQVASSQENPGSGALGGATGGTAVNPDGSPIANPDDKENPNDSANKADSTKLPNILYLKTD